LSIANKYKVSVKDLIELNNLPDDYQVSESETISISKQQGYAEKPTQKPKPSAKKTTKPKAKTHLVKKGESLSVIANKYKCSVNDLKKWNGLRNNNIKPGQRLKILK
jgi:membrane-bound lytic murein transglycosylase D